MKCVVTGGAGFIGSAIAKRLEKDNHDVVIVDDFSAGYETNLKGFSGEIIKASVVEADKVAPAIKDANLIFHLGAMNALPDCSNDMVATMEVNVKGTASLLDMARRTAAKDCRFVFTSSSAVYEGSDKLPNTESDQPNPHLAYAISKLQGEFLCRSFHKSFGLPYTIIRPFNVYGEGQDFRREQPPVMCALAIPLLQGKQATIYGDGTQARDFIHVEDMAELFVVAATHPKGAGQAFNGGVGKSVNINDIYKMICSELGTDKEPIYAPAQGLFDKYPALKEGNFVFRDEAVTHESLKTTQADTTKTKDLLGWEPKISMEEGVKRSVEYVKQNL
ncbi:MAG: NAD-dependent epimerase/dehydratase family protein [Candidatus Woesearchaeota archaeon]|jgi:nucleoside-diphosphate-sugar epimerase|nr:NAD-dependent epimerase/dehydratase family protein [Candidatus Woesearchaeota archaeon]MDP7181010.1 NAD-dependent epimerase/dehydratase family protein [Candidatus Woesearchaeota archaeon]MDP7198369.1 NAD-dependent epimerase/dehydratase family protein [Candidatus Woesearchaeota archaeon]MDP7467471.1 NAD-dependent epimerase/dehydratase family protein [Candidatus Woesearchaeota archaeon]MDP7647698.1 NAD-dependent epimerase/dehydratase family protein [Candidatus Woesearchaeota archaeon]